MTSAETGAFLWSASSCIWGRCCSCSFAVLLPEGIIAALVAVALPLVGPAINLPTDAVIDWVFLGIAAYALLGILPRAVVAEHHAQRVSSRTGSQAAAAVAEMRPAFAGRPALGVGTAPPT